MNKTYTEIGIYFTQEDIMMKRKAIHNELADLRSLCSHKKDIDSTKEQVNN